MVSPAKVQKRTKAEGGGALASIVFRFPVARSKVYQKTQINSDKLPDSDKQHGEVVHSRKTGSRRRGEGLCRTEVAKGLCVANRVHTCNRQLSELKEWTDRQVSSKHTSQIESRLLTFECLSDMNPELMLATCTRPERE